MVIAPMSANLLAKVANGLCDDLITCVIRAWDTDPANGRKILVAPAMNTFMWTHPITAQQLSTLTDAWSVKTGDSHASWFEVLPPQVKTLACDDTGQGGMCDWVHIVSVIEDRLDLNSGSKVMRIK